MSLNSTSSYKLVITDIDGTLVNSSQRIPARSADAVSRLKRLGVGFSLATGRMPQSAHPFITQLAVSEPCIVYNGCRIIRPDGTALYDRSLDPRIAAAAIENGRAAGFAAFLYQDDRILVERVEPRVTEQERKDGVACTLQPNLCDHLGATPTKVLLVGDADQALKLSAFLSDRFGADATVVRSEQDYVEILPPSVNKGNALAELCRLLQIEIEEVIAIGDNLNDLEMLRAAGLGVAPANAQADILAAADFVTEADNTQGAVAEAIEQLIIEPGAHDDAASVRHSDFS